jgi:hypothetical protein
MKFAEVNLQQRLAKYQATKCTSCQVGMPQRLSKTSPIRTSCLFGKTNHKGTDKIQSSQGIDQVDPDTPSVLPDEIEYN